jgi:hypothetical protein
MTEFDEEMEAKARKRNALYQRYSDDILILVQKTAEKFLKLLSKKAGGAWPFSKSAARNLPVGNRLSHVEKLPGSNAPNPATRRTADPS